MLRALYPEPAMESTRKRPASRAMAMAPRSEPVRLALYPPDDTDGRRFCRSAALDCGALPASESACKDETLLVR